MKSLYFGTRFIGLGVSISESLVFDKGKANDTALFRCVVDRPEVLGRLSIGAVVDGIDIAA